MNRFALSLTRFILFDFQESPYSDFTKYWEDHETHYLIILDDCYTEVDAALKKLGHLL